MLFNEPLKVVRISASGEIKRLRREQIQSTHTSRCYSGIGLIGPWKIMINLSGELVMWLAFKPGIFSTQVRDINKHLSQPALDVLYEVEKRKIPAPAKNQNQIKLLSCLQPFTALPELLSLWSNCKYLETDLDDTSEDGYFRELNR